MHYVTLWCRLKESQRTPDFLGGVYSYLTLLQRTGRISGFTVLRPPPGTMPPPPGEISLTLWGSRRDMLLEAASAGHADDAALDSMRVPVFSLVDATLLEERSAAPHP